MYKLIKHDSTVLNLPRTVTDFARIDDWISSGVNDEIIFKWMKKEWRSEVFTLAGKLHCALCLQRINRHVCIECRQSEERSI